MTEKQQKIEAICNSIFEEESFDDLKKSSIKDFITTTINGDTIITSIVARANLSPNSTGIIVYVLTNLRLIKIDIGQEIKSSSYFLNTISSIERNLLNDGRIEFGISFQNGAFGLRYPATNQEITAFFQQVEKPRQ